MDRFVVDGLRGHPGLLEALETLRQVVLDGGEGGHDSWRAKPVGGVREVGQVALDHIYTFEANKLPILPGSLVPRSSQASCCTTGICPGSTGPSAPSSQSWWQRILTHLIQVTLARRHKDTGNRGFSLGGKQQLLPAKLLSAVPRLAGQVFCHLEKTLCDIISPHGTANITETLSQVLQASQNTISVFSYLPKLYDFCINYQLFMLVISISLPGALGTPSRKHNQSLVLGGSLPLC